MTAIWSAQKTGIRCSIGWQFMPGHRQSTETAVRLPGLQLSRNNEQLEHRPRGLTARYSFAEGGMTSPSSFWAILSAV